jgi:hypothetical protein
MRPMSTQKSSIQIFKVGTHTPMQGAALSFSESDLAATAAAYDPALHEAPLVIGHPSANGPAHGWVQSLGVAGGALEAVPHQVDPDFAEQVRKGSYKKISASFYEPTSPNNPKPGVYYLRHVGFLGALPPAVKGLRPVSFAETESGVIEFGDFDDRVNAGLWRGLREWIIAKFGMDAADQALPGWSVDAIQESAAQPEAVDEAQEVTQFSETTTEVQVSPEERAALEAENAQLKQQLAERDAREAAAKAEERRKTNADFTEGLIAKGILAPKHKDTVVALLDVAAAPDAGGQVVSFGDGDNKQSLLIAIQGFLDEMPKVIEFGDVATHDRAAGTDGDGDTVSYAENADPERIALDKQIRAHAKQHGVDYATAARAFMNK